MSDLASLAPTPPERLPLHSRVKSSTWFACEHPERPRDGHWHVDWRCRACLIGAQASLIRDGDELRYIRKANRRHLGPFWLSELINRKAIDAASPEDPKP